MPVTSLIITSPLLCCLASNFNEFFHVIVIVVFVLAHQPSSKVSYLTSRSLARASWLWTILNDRLTSVGGEGMVVENKRWRKKWAENTLDEWGRKRMLKWGKELMLCERVMKLIIHLFDSPHSANSLLNSRVCGIIHTPLSLLSHRRSYKSSYWVTRRHSCVFTVEIPFTLLSCKQWFKLEEAWGIVMKNVEICRASEHLEF